MGRPSIMSNGNGNGNGNGNVRGIPNGINGNNGMNGNNGINGNGNRSGGPAWLQNGNNCEIPQCKDWCYPCGPPECCTPWYCPPNRPTVYPPPIFIPYRLDWYQARLC